MKRFSDQILPGPVRQSLQRWSDLNVNPSEFPLTLEQAQEHADTFMQVAAAQSITAGQVKEAISGRDLRDLMFVKMRESVDEKMAPAE